MTSQDHGSWYEWFAEVILAIALAATAVSVIYYTLGVKVEGQVVTNNLNIVLGDLVGTITDIIPSELAANQTAIENALVLPASLQAAFVTQDAAVTAANNALMTQVFIILGAVLGGAIVIIAILWYVAKKKGQPFSLKHLLVKILILSAFGVAMVEICFLYGVAANFQSASANEVKKAVIVQTLAYGASA